MKRTLFIVGGGYFQSFAAREAMEMGLRVIVSDQNPSAPAMQYADIPLLLSTRDEEGHIREAKKINEETKIDGAMTIGTDVSRTVAKITNALGLPGVSYETAARASDKILMRETLKKNGVPVPKFLGAANEEEAKNAAADIGYPLVLKPTDSMGARGVVYVNSEEELTKAFSEAREYSSEARVIIEEYMEGPEFSIDALVHKGKIYWAGLANRIIQNPPHFVEEGHIIPGKFSSSLEKEIYDVMKQAIEAVGIRNGAAKGDIKQTSEGIKIGEIAARLSGGFMSTHTTPAAFGINPVRAAIRIAIGEDPGPLRPLRNLVAYEHAFFPKPGKIRKILGIEEVKSLPGFVDIIILRGPGEMAVQPRNNVEKAGNVIVTGSTREEAEARMSDILSKVKFITDDDN